MITTVEGIYKNGRVEFKDLPPNVKEGRVLVTFLPTDMETLVVSPQKGQMIQFGMFPELKSLTDEDFKAAEFHGDPDDGLDWG